MARKKTPKIPSPEAAPQATPPELPPVPPSKHGFLVNTADGSLRVYTAQSVEQALALARKEFPTIKYIRVTRATLHESVVFNA